MKPRSSLVLWLGCLLLSLLSMRALAALPPEVERLIQSDKYAEALARVNALLQQSPDNLELQAARKELLALVPAESPATSKGGDTRSLARIMLDAEVSKDMLPHPSGQVSGRMSESVRPQVAAASASSELSPIDAKELDLIRSDLSVTTGDARAPLLKELVQRTSALLVSHEDSINLWAMYALAVYELNNADAAKWAGANLLRLGAELSKDDQMISLLATLKRKGWLMTRDEYEKDKVVVAKQTLDQREKEDAAAAAKKRAFAAKIAELRQQYRTCIAEEARWDEVTSKDRHARNPTYETYSVDKSYEWGIKAAQIIGEVGKLGLKGKDLEEFMKVP